MLQLWSDLPTTGPNSSFDPRICPYEAIRDIAFFKWCWTEPIAEPELELASMIKYRYGDQYPNMCKIKAEDISKIDLELARIDEVEQYAHLCNWCSLLSDTEMEILLAKMSDDMRLAKEGGFYGDGCEGGNLAENREDEDHVFGDSE